MGIIHDRATDPSEGVTGVRVTPNKAGVRRWMQSSEARDGMAKLGKIVRDDFRANAPVVTGLMRNSARVDVDTTPTGVVARVVVDVPYAHRALARNPALLKALDAIQ